MGDSSKRQPRKRESTAIDGRLPPDALRDLAAELGESPQPAGPEVIESVTEIKSSGDDVAER